MATAAWAAWTSSPATRTTRRAVLLREGRPSASLHRESTRRFDLLVKRDTLQSVGVPSYWLADPDGPSVTVLELRDGAYEQVGRAEGGQRLQVALPYPMETVPARLLD